MKKYIDDSQVMTVEYALEKMYETFLTQIKTKEDQDIADTVHDFLVNSLLESED
jgi:hypothetical protein